MKRITLDKHTFLNSPLDVRNTMFDVPENYTFEVISRPPIAVPAGEYAPLEFAKYVNEHSDDYALVTCNVDEFNVLPPPYKKREASLNVYLTCPTCSEMNVFRFEIAKTTDHPLIDPSILKCSENHSMVRQDGTIHTEDARKFMGKPVREVKVAFEEEYKRQLEKEEEERQKTNSDRRNLHK